MKYSWGIKQRVLFLAIVPVVTISLLLGVYFTNIRIDDLFQALTSRGTAITSRLSSQGEYGVFASDTGALRKIARANLTNETSSITFYNKKGDEIASAGKLTSNIKPPSKNIYSVHVTPNKNNNTIEFLSSVTLPEVIIDDYSEQVRPSNDDNLTVIGWLKVELELKPTKLKEYQVLIHSGLIMLLGLSISGLLALRISYQVTRPILSLADAVEQIKQGKLDTRIHTHAHWELEILESGINTMTSAIQDAHKEMQLRIEQATANLRNTNVELEKSRKQAEIASKTKSEFLASMSHELRTPLNGIIGFINLVLKTELTEKQKDFIITIQKSASTLLTIINDILDFSKIEAGKLQLNLEPMNIRDCVDDALTLLAPSAHEKALEIIPFIYSDVPPHVIGDSFRIKQVITNLVSNSIKFTTKGSIIVRVMLEKDTLKNTILCISVTDTGIGLTKLQQKGLFHAFNQLSPNITRKFGGTGLGLVICKKLVKKMSGKMDLESTAGKGSTFWFTLQVNKIVKQNKSLDKLLNKQKSSLQQIRILLFEGHPVVRLSLVHLLESWGMRVQEVEHYEEITTLVKQEFKAGDPFQMTLIGINQLDPNNNIINNIITNIKEKYLCPVGALVNTTDLLIHNDILKIGATLCLAKPVCRAKFFNALCEIFLRTEKNIVQSRININTQDIPKLHVLAVDDNSSNLKLLSALLENIGTTVSTADCGESALEAIDKHLYDLILMDINMPGIDGIETSSAIRKSNTINKNTPIVALSAHILLAEKESFSGNINDYLTKPINEHQLRAAIYKWTHKGISKHKIPTIQDQVSLIEKSTLHIDWELSKNLASEKTSLAKEMLAQLIASLPKEQKLINKSYANKDFNALRDHIHKIHGACCYTGVPKLKAIVKSLETSLTTPNKEKLHSEILNLNTEIAKIIDCYQMESYIT